MMFRNPKTKNERTQFYIENDEVDKFQIRLRAKRNPNNLPTNWDDIAITHVRSWKKSRETQYKS